MCSIPMEIIDQAIALSPRSIIRLIRSEAAAVGARTTENNSDENSNEGNNTDENSNERTQLMMNVASTITTNAATSATPPITGITGHMRSLDYTNLFTWVIILLIVKFIIDNLFVTLLVIFMGITMPIHYNKLASINVNRKDRSKASKIALLLLQFFGVLLGFDLCINLLSNQQFLPKNLIVSRLKLQEYNGNITFFDMLLTSRLVDYYFYCCFVVFQTIISLFIWLYYNYESNKLTYIKYWGLERSESTKRDVEAPTPTPEGVESCHDRIESLQTLALKKLMNTIDCVSFTWRSIIVAPIWYSYFHAGLSSWIGYIYLLLKFTETVWNIYTLFNLLSVGMSGVLEYGRRSTLADLSQCQECSICYENPKDNMPLTLKCEHSFCEVCIVEWLERDPSCPICRCKVTSNFTNQRNFYKGAHGMAVAF